MNGIVLNVAPKFDEATEYTYRWNRELAGQIRFDVELLERDAVREKVVRALEERVVDLVVFYDHGREDSLIGNDGYPVLDLNNYALLKGTEVYTLACLSAKKLGERAFHAGCKAYWGYVDVWCFTTDFEEHFKYLACLGLIIRKIQGLTWEAAKRQVIRKYDYYIDKAVKAGNPWAAAMLRHDRDCLVVYNFDRPKPECSSSRILLRLFGAKTLERLRRLRDQLKWT